MAAVARDSTAAGANSSTQWAHSPVRNMSSSIRVGQYVQWNWGNGKGKGKTVERFEEDVERTIGGSSVKRIASSDSPAFLIEQEDGQEVLESESELEPA